MARLVAGACPAGRGALAALSRPCQATTNISQLQKKEKVAGNELDKKNITGRVGAADERVAVAVAGEALVHVCAHARHNARAMSHEDEKQKQKQNRGDTGSRQRETQHQGEGTEHSGSKGGPLQPVSPSDAYPLAHSPHSREPGVFRHLRTGAHPPLLVRLRKGEMRNLGVKLGGKFHIFAELNGA